MFFKKKITAALLPLVYMSFATTINIAHADDNIVGVDQTLTLAGEITGGTCEVEFPATITFADMDVNDLKTPDSAKTYESLTPPEGAQTLISLTNCSPQQEVSVTLLGTADLDDQQALKNESSTSPAKYVAMRAFLHEADAPEGAELAPNVASDSYSADADGNLTLEFWPGLLKTSPTAIPTPGNVDFTGQIQINYL